ncbi:MAG: GatB/YqeY domain-containing protein [Bacteroidales bacterium]|nr:GatB/YqeY domain-containing protein [Bacteroidales bacterium]
MTLEEIIQNDLKEAMKAKDAVALASVRAIKSAILLAKTAEGAADKALQDSDIVKLIQKLVKQRKESAEQYTAAGRAELAENELAEASKMEKYLPKQLSAEEIEKAVATAIAELGAKTKADMGKVMGVVTKRLAGLADGRAISDAVKRMLE